MRAKGPCAKYVVLVCAPTDQCLNVIEGESVLSFGELNFEIMGKDYHSE